MPTPREDIDSFSTALRLSFSEVASVHGIDPDSLVIQIQETMNYGGAMGLSCDDPLGLLGKQDPLVFISWDRDGNFTNDLKDNRESSKCLPSVLRNAFCFYGPQNTFAGALSEAGFCAVQVLDRESDELTLLA